MDYGIPQIVDPDLLKRVNLISKINSLFKKVALSQKL